MDNTKAFRNILRDVKWMKQYKDYDQLDNYLKNTLDGIEYTAEQALSKFVVVAFAPGKEDNNLETFDTEDEAALYVEEQREQAASFYMPGSEPWFYRTERRVDV